MRNASLDDEIRLDRPDDFLDRKYILRILDDRTAHPLEMVRIFSGIDAIHPRARRKSDLVIDTHLRDLGCAFALELVVFRHQGFLLMSTRTSYKVSPSGNTQAG